MWKFLAALRARDPDVADMAEWGEMNKVYITYFDKHLPARSAFGTTGLALSARLEIECIAVLD